MSKRYRQLLPVPFHENSPPNSQPSASSGDEPLKRQRIGTQLACNSCRKRKIRCNGRKPLCEACWRRGEKEPCIYVENKMPGQASKETEQILELFDIMKTRPEAQAIDVLRVLRCHNDLDTTMSMIQPRIAHVAIEQEQVSKHTRFLGLESELMARHSLAFPALQPLESDILKKLFNASRSSTVDNDNDTPMLNESPNPFPAYNPTRSPEPALRFCDERLAKLNIGHWSSVPIPSNLAAKIISLYLETDHPLLGPFDPALFVDDLVHCRTRYCSELLVSALMYWGCQMYTSVDSSAKEFTQQFCEEAEKRWSLEKSTDSLLTLAATQLLGFSYMGNGKDHYVLTFVSEVNSMGTRMGLFGVETSVAISKAKQVSPELQSATSYAAWGTFNWIVLMTLFYQQPGLTYFEHPPVLPIPGHVWHSTPDNSPESIQQTLLQTYMGDTFPILCRFWRIMHEVTLKYYRDQPFPLTGLNSHITLAFAEYKYRELIAWAETLPASMVRSEQSPHHVLVFQRSSPDAAYKASVNQLKRLMVVYRESHACSSYSMLWHTALIQTANAILGDKKDTAWRFYLYFCVQTYGDLRRSFTFAETTGRSLLSMALDQGDLSADEARKLMGQFEENRLSGPTEDIRATFMADLNLAMTDPGTASVESLSDRFEDIALFREFTNGGDSNEDEPMDSDDNAWDTL
ncbi:nitrogen assimilation transcription factor nit-4 [Fusarium heterosporum]|uniref:Nitrogen assimilation transcription factor nit-4 n=1 Tax=Fusarium heterosporum TaxID=42747 RepID=A0A8H5WE63_FUSHE|nr:nitrogen assimilation transcription factor nit-4 [Fusarium heterosporum]